MAAQRWILHADLDAFYASVEQRDHPELRGRPVVVGGKSGRGVVAAASYEARAFGIRSAMPGFRARELCPHAVFLPPNMAHYAAISAEVHSIFERFTSEIEPLALDEAFLDITGSLRLFSDPLTLARALKRAVLEATELRISVGLGPNKLVAKIACTLGKPDGLRIVEPAAVRAFLDPLPARRLPGIGPVLGERLLELGIHTAGELARAEPRELARIAGSHAPQLIALARGEDDRPVVSNRVPKSYGEENTFEQDVMDRERVTAALTAHAEAVARRLRRDDYRGSTITVKAKLARARGTRIARGPGGGREPFYPLVSRSRTLATPTDDGQRIRDVAVALWDEAGIREPVRLLGVSVSKLEKGAGRQLELFPSARDRLGPTLDAIADRFGRGAIGRAVEAPQKMTPGRTKKRGEG